MMEQTCVVAKTAADFIDEGALLKYHGFLLALHQNRSRVSMYELPGQKGAIQSDKRLKSQCGH